MKKMRNSLVVLFATVAMMFASIAPANALSIENRQHWYGSQQKCYYNYNWFETVFLGKQDGWRYGNQNC